MPTVTRDGARIWYGDQGQGPPVLLVHGGLFDPAASEWFWVETGIAADLVAARYRIIMPDRRCSGGRTTAPFGLHTWDVEAADLVAVLRQADVSSAHVVTGSIGCSAAIRLALSEPAVVRSLVLCWPVDPDVPGHDLRQAFAVSANFIAARGPAAYLAELRAHGLPRPGQAGERPGFPWGVALLRDEALAAQFTATPAPEAAAIVRDSARALLRGNLLRGVDLEDAARLAQLVPSVTVVPPDPEGGSHTAAIARKLAAAIPGAQLASGVPIGPSPAWPAVLRQALAGAGG